MSERTFDAEIRAVGDVFVDREGVVGATRALAQRFSEPDSGRAMETLAYIKRNYEAQT